MDRYQRVEKPRAETPVSENEIRITAQGRVRNYITYALSLLQDKDADEIIVKAMGRAISKTVMIAELIKRRVVGLHQNTSIESADITDTWEPLEEGLLPLETTRHVSMITIILSKKEPDTLSPGYQSPLPASQVKPMLEFDYGEPSPRGRGRGRGGPGRGGRGRENINEVAEYEDGGWDGGRGYGGRGRGRGRGGGFRGRGAGYGGGYHYQESGGINGYGPGTQGRGNFNDVAEYEDGGWDSGRIYGGRGRGRGRGGGFRGRGAGYDGGRGAGYDGGRGAGYDGGYYFQESGGVNGYGGPDIPAAQGRGRGRGMARGRGRGRGRGMGYRADGPVQADA